METPSDDDCFAIRQASRFVSQIYSRHLSHVGLTSTQYSMLNRLHRLGRMTMLELSDAMVMDRTTLVRTIKPMQRDALVDSGKNGGRVLTVGITDAGIARLEVAHVHWTAAQGEFEERFGGERAQALRRELFALTDE